MKYMTVAALIISSLAFASSAIGATVGKGIVSTSAAWGFVDTASADTFVYRLADPENKAVCYFAFYGSNAVPDMECVK